MVSFRSYQRIRLCLIWHFDQIFRFLQIFCDSQLTSGLSQRSRACWVFTFVLFSCWISLVNARIHNRLGTNVLVVTWPIFLGFNVHRYQESILLTTIINSSAILLWSTNSSLWIHIVADLLHFFIFLRFVLVKVYFYLISFVFILVKLVEFMCLVNLQMSFYRSATDAKLELFVFWFRIILTSHSRDILWNLIFICDPWKA